MQKNTGPTSLRFTGHSVEIPPRGTVGIEVMSTSCLPSDSSSSSSASFSRTSAGSVKAKAGEGSTIIIIIKPGSAQQGERRVVLRSPMQMCAHKSCIGCGAELFKQLEQPKKRTDESRFQVLLLSMRLPLEKERKSNGGKVDQLLHSAIAAADPCDERVGLFFPPPVFRRATPSCAGIGWL
ncbi:hypothetical protein AOLI_G00090860 [Acnodon oligacanthus]